MKKKAFNPFLPINEYVPDGEPHVFGDRVYIFGSHDKEGGHTFCMLDYVTWSAPVDDLSDWRYEGVIYRAEQDPQYGKKLLNGENEYLYMYAPDVVQGNDGKFYLYYSMSGEYGYAGYVGPISVAVAESPAGPYEFLGFVRDKDGKPMERYVCFDPAVMNDGGTIRLFYGTQYDFEERDDFLQNEEYIKQEMSMFGRTKEEILSYPDSIMGAVTLTLDDDMLTVKEEPHHIIPYRVKGTSFEEHPFFEGSSMRKVGDKYYFIYSSMQNHELCYAVSDKPDSGFTFGGTIVSNGDIGFNGRKAGNKLNMTGTTHGSIIEIQGEWYVFYHRLTHKSDYSRQACAERIRIEDDGSIKQVEITSCGLNGGPLPAEGIYPAVIACNITNGHMPHGCNSIYTSSFPNVTNIGEERFIAEICDGTLIGFKYFDFKSVSKIGIEARVECDANLPRFDGPVRVDVRSDGDEELSSSSVENENTAKKDIEAVKDIKGYFEVRLSIDGEAVGRIDIPAETADPLEWKELSTKADIPDGVHGLYFIYHGEGRVQLKNIWINDKD
ncbi:MAG: family 43 glycosylhydrolase [Eubacterium sp.]|nr:family 43 glycosylhydrolase [Eubacterium sp.]